LETLCVGVGGQRESDHGGDDQPAEPAAAVAKIDVVHMEMTDIAPAQRKSAQSWNAPRLHARSCCNEYVLGRTALLLAASAASAAEADTAPPHHVNVAPQALEARRLAGDRIVEPDAETKKKIVADQRRIAAAIFQLCIDERGAVVTTDLLHSSGYPDWDDKIRSTMRETWRYRAFELKGHLTPVCTAVTQTFKNEQAPAQRPSAPKQTT
jgi:hypothetical protein